MALTDATGLSRVSLRPAGYELGFVDGDTWDNNWLIIEGEIATAQERWSFREPCLQVSEAEEIAEWLQRIATRNEALEEAHRSGAPERRRRVAA